MEKYVIIGQKNGSVLFYNDGSRKYTSFLTEASVWDLENATDSLQIPLRRASKVLDNVRTVRLVFDLNTSVAGIEVGQELPTVNRSVVV